VAQQQPQDHGPLLTSASAPASKQPDKEEDESAPSVSASAPASKQPEQEEDEDVEDVTMSNEDASTSNDAEPPAPQRVEPFGPHTTLSPATPLLSASASASASYISEVPPVPQGDAPETNVSHGSGKTGKSFLVPKHCVRIYTYTFSNLCVLFFSYIR
jgi:hypothetical protein